MEPEEGIEKVLDALKTCRLYKEMYYSHKDNLKTYFKDEPVVEWQFEANLIFSRIDQLSNKLETIDVRLIHIVNTSVIIIAGKLTRHNI